jgi:hypothetical protein
MLNQHFGKHRKKTNLVLFSHSWNLDSFIQKRHKTHSGNNNTWLSSCMGRSSFSREISTDSRANENITGTQLCKDLLCYTVPDSLHPSDTSGLKKYCQRPTSDPSAENIRRWIQCCAFKHKGNWILKHFSAARLGDREESFSLLSTTQRKRLERCTPIEHTHFRTAIFANLQTLLAFITAFVHIYISILLSHAVRCTARNYYYFFLNISSNHLRIFS